MLEIDGFDPQVSQHKVSLLSLAHRVLAVSGSTRSPRYRL